MTAGTTFVQASERSGLFGFFEDLFRPPPPPVPQVSRSPRRYATLPSAKRVSEVRPRYASPRQSVDLSQTLRTYQRPRSLRADAVPYAVGGPQTVCVRTCDGYVFPLGRLRSQSDVPVHQAACAAACPNAQTALFTLPTGRTELDQAVSLKGRPYLAAAWANVYRQKRVQHCSCQPQGVAAAPIPIGHDSTVRIGDVVAKEDGAEVVTNLSNGTVQLADYRSTRFLSRVARRAIDLRVGAIRRDTEQAAFRRALRLADRRNQRVRMAEVGFSRMRTLDASMGFGDIASSGVGNGFKPVRLVTPWLDEHSPH